MEAIRVEFTAMIPLAGFVPEKVFFTKGVGAHKERLTSFEMALRDAGIAHFNLVTVSSILPANCKRIPVKDGLSQLLPGQIVFCVMARSDTDEHGRLATAAVGVARPRNKDHFGFLSEHHGHGMTRAVAGDYGEDLAVEMLCTVMGLDYDTNADWNEKKQRWKIQGDIYDSFNVDQTRKGTRGQWTTVLTAAVFCA